MPKAEVNADEALVRRLLEAQHADLAERSIVAVGEGWDNAIFRLGEDLAVRLPRHRPLRELGVALLPAVVSDT